MAETYYYRGVTLLITHYNRSGSLERLLKACRELNYTFEDIVVSDDCSDADHFEALEELAKEYNFSLIAAVENKGLGHNINKGQAAIKTPYTLYVQEDFIPYPAFGEHFFDGFRMMEERKELDFVRFYSYIKYPHLKPFEKGFSEMVYKPWSPFYYKIYYYTDHPHLRRSTFIEKFGEYTEGVSVDRSEYRMCIGFIQQGGKGLFYNDYLTLLDQKNHATEPSTATRDKLSLTKNPIIKFVRDTYRQFRYNFDLWFMRPNYGYGIKSEHARISPNKNLFVQILKAIADKSLSLYVKLRYPNAEISYRQFYKDTYYCQLKQLKYIIRDYVIRKKYKVVSFNGEFAPEIQFTLPFAYWHHKNGTLKQTKSSKFTQELYFFSENHEESFESRSNDGNYSFEVPRILYSQDYNIDKWAQVPLKETYRNDIYVYDKPILIIANRYNMEWGEPPVSYFSIVELAFMINKLKDSYMIIYNRPRSENIITDESEIYDLNEYGWLSKEHPEVVLMEDLFKENKAKARNFNHLQLMVYANSNHFISTHGGTSAFASYFCGINLIFSKKGPEHHFNCYTKLYPKLSGATILHAKTERELQINIDKYFLIPPDK